MEFLKNLSIFWIIPVALIPPLIHFLFKKKAVSVDYSTLFLIKMIYKKSKKKMLLREIIIVALRSLMFALIFLLFLHPIIRKTSAIGNKVNFSNFLVVVDDSASMRAVYDGKSFWLRGVEFADKFIKNLPGSSLGILYFCASGKYFEGGKSELLKDLKSANVTFLPANLNSCILDAVSFGENRFNNTKFPVVVISDFQKNSFSLSSLKEVKEKLKLVKVSRPINNVSIVKGEVSRSFALFKQAYRGKVEAKNFTSIKVKKIIDVFVNNKKVSSAEFSLKPFGKNVKSIWWDASGSWGFFKIPEDGFAPDNKYYFVQGVGNPISILLVEGDPEPIPTSGGVYYIYTALKLWEQNSDNVKVSTILPDKLSKLRLEDYSIIFLSNVPSISNLLSSKILDWIKNGGILVVVLGDMIRVDDYNSSGLLLGGQLRGKISGVSPVGISIESINFPLDESIKMKLKDVHFTGYTLFENIPPDSKVLLNLVNGVPLMIEKLYGKGRIVFYTSTVDDYWTDFPFKTSFLPFFYKLIIYLSSRGISVNGRYFTTGAKVKFVAGQRVNIEVIDPAGNKLKVKLEHRKGYWRGEYNRTLVPGYYEVLVAGKLVNSLSFVVNIPLSEMETIYASVPSSGEKTIAGMSVTDLSPLLIIFMLLLLFVEEVVGKWF